MKELEETLNVFEEKFHPTSIFLYGSHAKGDAKPESDYELGLLFPEADYVLSATIRAASVSEKVSPYPFKLEAFVAGTPDTPFQKRLYMRELALTARTLRGEKIVENLTPLPIRLSDLLADAQFRLGCALSAVVAHKDGAIETAKTLFYKNALYAARDLVILQSGTFPTTHEDIYTQSIGLVQEWSEYVLVLEHAFDMRTSTESYVPERVFRNITFINQHVIPLIEAKIAEKGADFVCLP